MLVESLQSIDVDIPACYKTLWFLTALDETEDYLVSKKIMCLVAEDFKKFRAEIKKLKLLLN